jgi:hypothetical protein
MPLTHERFARAAGSIPLLRADDRFQRFYTARVKLGRSGTSALSQLLPQLRKSPAGFATAFIAGSRAIWIATASDGDRHYRLNPRPTFRSARAAQREPKAPVYLSDFMKM